MYRTLPTYALLTFYCISVSLHYICVRTFIIVSNSFSLSSSGMYNREGRLRETAQYPAAAGRPWVNGVDLGGAKVSANKRLLTPPKQSFVVELEDSFFFFFPLRVYLSPPVHRHVAPWMMFVCLMKEVAIRLVLWWDWFVYFSILFHLAKIYRISYN